MYLVKDIEGKGRGCFAASDIKTGQLVVSFDELVAIPAFAWRNYVCSFCFQFNWHKALDLGCKKCEMAWYCSQQCLQSACNAHLKSCDALKSLYTIFWKDDRYEEASVRNNALLAANSLCQGVDYTELCSLDISTMEAWLVKDFRLISEAVASATNRTFCEEVVMGFLAHSECNCFSFWDDTYEQYGLALCIPASMFNHSCSPNVCKTNNGSVLMFHAIRDISQGEELQISYVQLSETRERRREILRKHFGFSCICPRCKLGPDKDSFANQYVCPCGGVYCTLLDCQGSYCSVCNRKPDASCLRYDTGRERRSVKHISQPFQAFENNDDFSMVDDELKNLSMYYVLSQTAITLSHR